MIKQIPHEPLRLWANSLPDLCPILDFISSTTTYLDSGVEAFVLRVNDKVLRVGKLRDLRVNVPEVLQAESTWIYNNIIVELLPHCPTIYREGIPLRRHKWIQRAFTQRLSKYNLKNRDLHLKNIGRIRLNGAVRLKILDPSTLYTT